MSEEIDYEKLRQCLKIDIEFALDIVDEWFGTAEEMEKEPPSTSRSEGLKERLIAFQELLRVLFPISIKSHLKEKIEELKKLV